MKIKLICSLILISPFTLASEATVGDFGTNQQAETITTTTSTTTSTTISTSTSTTSTTTVTTTTTITTTTTTSTTTSTTTTVTTTTTTTEEEETTAGIIEGAFTQAQTTAASGSGSALGNFGGWSLETGGGTSSLDAACKFKLYVWQK